MSSFSKKNKSIKTKQQYIPICSTQTLHIGHALPRLQYWSFILRISAVGSYSCLLRQYPMSGFYGFLLWNSNFGDLNEMFTIVSDSWVLGTKMVVLCKRVSLRVIKCSIMPPEEGTKGLKGYFSFWCSLLPVHSSSCERPAVLAILAACCHDSLPW